MLDDHASDSNHKKTLGIVSSLCRSHSTAVDMLDHAKTYYQNLTDQVGTTAMEKWTFDIEAAECCWKYDISVMSIYAAKLDNDDQDVWHLASGMPNTPLSIWMELLLAVEEKQLVKYLILF